MGHERPLVGVSPCLLGRLVRYDGGHKHDRVVQSLAARVRWLEVCPEAGAGLGTPREPARLVQQGGGLRFVGRQTGSDFSDQLMAFIDAEVAALPWSELAGWVLKARSPSCGLGTSPRFSSVSAPEPQGSGDGLWSAALRAWDPDLPLIDEDGLADPARREGWLAAVEARSH